MMTHKSSDFRPRRQKQSKIDQPDKKPSQLIHTLRTGHFRSLRYNQVNSNPHTKTQVLVDPFIETRRFPRPHKKYKDEYEPYTKIKIFSFTTLTIKSI